MTNYLDHQRYKFAVIIDAILEMEEKGQLNPETIYNLKQLQKLKDYKWQKRGSIQKSIQMAEPSEAWKDVPNQ
jgi:hypothetical protein